MPRMHIYLILQTKSQEVIIFFNNKYIFFKIGNFLVIFVFRVLWFDANFIRQFCFKKKLVTNRK